MEREHHYPFCYHEGMQIVKTERKRTHFKNIRQMFEEHEIKEVDTAILVHLTNYRYLNAYLIRILIEPTMGECKQAFINHRLTYLEERGLVARFAFTYTENGVEHKTPFVYEATYRTRTIFQRYEPKQLTESIEDIDRILRRISFNQFHIFLERQMGNALCFSVNHFDGKADGAYRFMSKGKPVNLFVISIRATEGWKKAYIERLRALLKHIKENDKSYSGIVVICENEMQALEAERHRMTSDCKTTNVYYICDYAAVSEGYIFSYLIHVKPEKNYSTYDLIMVEADGNIHVNTRKQEEEKSSEEVGAKKNEVETEEPKISKRRTPSKQHRKADRTS